MGRPETWGTQSTLWHCYVRGSRHGRSPTAPDQQPRVPARKCAPNQTSRMQTQPHSDVFLALLFEKLAAGVAAAAPHLLWQAAAASAEVIASMASGSSELARRLADVPDALPALATAVAAGGAAPTHRLQKTAVHSAVALAHMARVGPEHARRVAEVPHVLVALAAAVAVGSRDAAANSVWVRVCEPTTSIQPCQIHLHVL